MKRIISWNKTIFLSFLLLFPFLSNAQSNTVKITGQIVDVSSGQALVYATVSVLDAETSQVITGGITDESGNFSVDVKPGTYSIKAEYISYESKTFTKNIQSNTDLGKIALGSSASSLDAVVVRAETTQVEVRLDKKIYNIGKDLTTQGATITDALSNVPSVTVDVDGAISLRGNENVKILINGKPSALTGFGSDALKQLPADAIEKVEVITSPSARYSAEGTAGIINIVLKKEKTLGLNGSFSGNIGYPLSSGLSANLNLRTDNFNIFTTLGSYYRTSLGKAHYNNYYFDQTADDGTILEPTFDRVTEEREMDRLRKGFYTNTGMEFYLNEKSSIIGSVFMRFGDDEVTTTNFTNRFNNAILMEKSVRKETEFEDDKTYQFSLNYFNNFNDEGHKLTVDLQYENDNEERATYIGENTVFPENDSAPSEQIFENEKQKEFLFKADYVLPLGDAQFEAGIKSNLENEVTDYRLMAEDDTGNFVVDEGLTNVFDYTENVNAVYAQYGNKFGKFSFLLGLRLENTRMKGNIDSEFDDSGDLEDELGVDVVSEFDKDYLGLFPTVNLIYELGEKENITLGYNRRINRPRGWYINPFPSRSSRTNIFQGNPNLDPAFSNSFDLGYLKRWEKLTLTSSIYYKREENAFERVQEGTGEFYNGVEIIRSIPINLSSNNSYGFEAGLLYNPKKWLRLNGSFNLYKYESEGKFNGVDYGTASSSWFARFSSKVELPGKIDWQTSAFYYGPRESSQTETDGLFSMDLALSKDIMDGDATVSVNVRDLLNSRKRNSTTLTDRFLSESEFQWRSRTINLSFTYRFNQPNKKRNSNEPQMEGGMDEGGF
ncbi:MAG TPA: outer membrane beta-barrel family protein [Flavobacteriaceae bacterium]|nr:outer membrane beta-barrel family protein [Flavobacteriaceae bacterium]